MAVVQLTNPNDLTTTHVKIDETLIQQLKAKYTAIPEAKPQTTP